jgi:2-oxoglutarate ferredoxin oxidoreductase subunit alpha
MRWNILFGGKAGQGANILTYVLAKALVKWGYYVFYSRDYQSLIRGGHNFNVLSFSDKPIFSNDLKINMIISLDKDSINFHKKDLVKSGMIIEGEDSNMFFAGRIFKILGIDFKFLDNELKDLKKRYKENLSEAKKGYLSENVNIKIKKLKSSGNIFMNGSFGISKGAMLSGLDVYYAYPMTPATGVLSELAQMSAKTIELENEIAVINAGVGSAITGAKSMVGTSGGGFDLMSETLSLTGVAGIPLVIYLCQRPGPGTGAATYTAQSDLNIARHSGHGEFTRVILAPSDPHLAESFFTLDYKPKIIHSKKSTSLLRYNSYEKNKEGSATDNPETIIKNVNERLKKQEDIKKESLKFGMFKSFGNKRSKNVILSWGSTKGAILDSIKGLDCEFIHILYLNPFPNIKKKLEGKNII